MDLNRPERLGIYLNDHLAGSTAGVEMARRTRSANADTEFGEPLALLCGEIEADRATLESYLATADVPRGTELMRKVGVEPELRVVDVLDLG